MATLLFFSRNASTGETRVLSGVTKGDVADEALPVCMTEAFALPASSENCLSRLQVETASLKLQLPLVPVPKPARDKNSANHFLAQVRCTEWASVHAYIYMYRYRNVEIKNK